MATTLRFLAIVALFLAPHPAAALGDCSGCVLGLYDDAGRTSNTGVGTFGVVKTIYVGLDLASPETGITGVEFSITGMNPFEILLVGVEWLPPATVEQGSPLAPSDTTATGGTNVGWAQCVTGSRTIGRLSILWFTPVANRVFRVTHRFPPSSSLYTFHPALVRCDGPAHTGVRITGGCYILNWDGNPNVGCSAGTVGAQPVAWTAVKQLYR